MEENNVENLETLQPEAEIPQQDIPLQELSEAQATPVRHQNTAESNIVRLRQDKEKAVRENAILAAKLAEYEKQSEEDIGYGDEDLVEGKHLKKEIDAVKKQLLSYQQQQVAQSDEGRLKQVYTDFDKVVNPENIQKLKEADPEMAETIATSKASLYARGASAYKRIKELGLIVEDKYEQEREKAKANIAKPRSLNSVSPQQGDSPLSMANAFANGLTPELKKQLWKEMEDAAKRH